VIIRILDFPDPQFTLIRSEEKDSASTQQSNESPTDPTYPADAADSTDPAHMPCPRRSANTRWHTAAGKYVHRLIGRIRRRRLVRGNLLASILIAAVAPIIQDHSVIMRRTAGRE